VNNILEESLPENSLGGLGRFFSDGVSVFLVNFSEFIFQFFVPGLIQLSEVESQIKGLKWNITEALTEPHGFTSTWAALGK
jgi:hypothetical protein